MGDQSERKEVHQVFADMKEKYVVIHSFMVDELGLKGNELMIFAIIYGFSQDGESYFKGSLAYLMEWTGASKVTVIKSLKSLVEKGYIEKIGYADFPNRFDYQAKIYHGKEI